MGSLLNNTFTFFCVSQSFAHIFDIHKALVTQKDNAAKTNVHSFILHYLVDIKPVGTKWFQLTLKFNVQFLQVIKAGILGASGQAARTVLLYTQTIPFLSSPDVSFYLHFFTILSLHPHFWKSFSLFLPPKSSSLLPPLYLCRHLRWI